MGKGGEVGIAPMTQKRGVAQMEVVEGIARNVQQSGGKQYGEDHWIFGREGTDWVIAKARVS